MKPKPIPLDVVNERFKVNFETGEIFWNIPHPNNRRVKSGDPVCLVPTGNGYLRVDLTIDGKVRKFLAHRLIYAMYLQVSMDNGLDVDHIDRDKHNNSISNLRIATRSQNLHNTVNRKGCYWCKNTNKWVARSCLNGKQKTIGYYDTEAEAYAAYVDYKNNIAKEFSPFN